MTFLRPGRRKAIFGSAAFLALIGSAFPLHASFTELRDGILAWLAAMLAAHVTQRATEKPPPEVKP